MHIFGYSKKKKRTVASRYKSLPPEVVKDRVNRAIKVADKNDKNTSRVLWERRCNFSLKIWNKDICADIRLNISSVISTAARVTVCMTSLLKERKTA